MSKLYNKIELIGQWDILAGMKKKNSCESIRKIIEEKIEALNVEVSEHMLSYMDTDEADDFYLYRFEFQVSRQKQQPEDILSNDRHQENDIKCDHKSDGMVYTSNPPQNKCIKCGEFYR